MLFLRDSLDQVEEGVPALGKDLGEDKIYFYRGISYAFKSNYKSAIADFNEILNNEPLIEPLIESESLVADTLASAYINRGIAHKLFGDKVNAIQDFRVALKLAHDPAMRQMAEQNLRELGAK